jgi:chitin disaccharide deacetylase
LSRFIFRSTTENGKIGTQDDIRYIKNMSSRRIVINADDFGLCRGVNDAVVKAHTEGVLTSTTVMVNMPAAEKAVELAKTLPALGIGVHLNLTEGSPIARDIRTNCLINPQNKFALKPGELFILSMTNSRVREAIKLELEAQIRWLLDRGLRPTHLDSHKHVHCLPVIFKIVCELAKRYGISAVRWPLERQKFTSGDWPKPDRKSLIRSHIIRNLARINRFQNSKYFKTDEFLGVAHTGQISVDFFKAVSLYSLAPAIEIMTHPGFAAGIDPAASRLVEQREYELNALCSEQTKLFFERAGIQLVNYGQL